MNKWGELGRNWKNIIYAWLYCGIFQKQGDPTEQILSESVTLQTWHKCSQKMTALRKRCINKLPCLEQCKLILACRTKIFSVFQETSLLGIESGNKYMRSTGTRLWQRKGRAHLTRVFRSVSIRRSTTQHGNRIELFVKTRFHFHLGKWHTNWKSLGKLNIPEWWKDWTLREGKKSP